MNKLTKRFLHGVAAISLALLCATPQYEKKYERPKNNTQEIYFCEKGVKVIRLTQKHQKKENCINCIKRKSKHAETREGESQEDEKENH